MSDALIISLSESWGKVTSALPSNRRFVVDTCPALRAYTRAPKPGR